MHIRIEHRLFDTLFEDEYRGVLALAQRIVGPAAAEDVVQDAFARLLGARIEDAVHARHWLYRTVLHRALDTIRRAKSRREREVLIPDPAQPPEPSELVEQRETRDRVRRALARLRPLYGAALSLRHSGFSYKEIALMLDVPTERVGVLLMRAEAALKKEFRHVESSR